jgi:2-methylcitrate dehydratase PrpD
MTAEYLQALAEFVVHTPAQTMPDDVRVRAREMIADCVACMMAGSRATEVRRLADMMFTRSSIKEASALGRAMRLPVEHAAYLGGVAGTWHDLDEGNLHTRTHAAIQIVPVLFAEAQRRALSGREVLDAFVIAYEVVSRLWQAASVRLAVHPHGTTGALAGAVALARTRGFDVQRTLKVMNVAMALGVVASRRTLNDGATVRNIYTASGARGAFDAVSLVEAGISGESDAPASVLGQIYGEDFAPSVAMRDLGSTWWLRKSYFKRFASARYLHGPLDLLEFIATEDSACEPALLYAADIERIDVDTYFMAATMAQQSVNSAFGMRFSLPAAMATRIVRGPSPLTEEPVAAFEDPRVHQLAQRIFVHEDAAATAVYPAQQPSRLRLQYHDGRVHDACAPRIVGEGDCPLPDGALCHKFIELCTPSLGVEMSEQAWATLMAIDTVEDLALVCQNWDDNVRA